MLLLNLLSLDFIPGTAVSFYSRGLLFGVEDLLIRYSKKISDKEGIRHAEPE